MKEKNIIKEIIMYVFLYAIYWFICRVLANQFISNNILFDLFCIIVPFVCLYLMYFIQKTKNSKTIDNKENSKLLSDNKWLKYIMMFIIISIIAFVIVIAFIFIMVGRGV